MVCLLMKWMVQGAEYKPGRVAAQGPDRLALGPGPGWAMLGRPASRRERMIVESPSTERRHSLRTRLRAAVIVDHPETGTLHLHTDDISDDGAYLLTDGQRLPDVGQVVQVQVQGLPDGDAPVVSMEVVRRDANGLGLRFVAADDSGGSEPAAP